MNTPIFRATLCNSDRIALDVITIPFPLSGSEYDHFIDLLTEQKMGDAVRQDCYVDTVTSGWPVLKALEGQYVNVDELDYFAKRLDSFCDYEAEQFQAACSAFGCRDIKDLINMTFCCQETTVISNFSKLEEAGKNHYLTIHGGAAPVAEVNAVDGKALAEQLIQSGEGKPTPYGLFFRNGMRMEEPYQGRSFPPYLWDERQAELELTKPDGTTAFFFLPFRELELKRFLQREGVPDISECKRALRLFLSEGEHIDLNGGIVELEEWNELCDTLNAMSQSQKQAFAAALEVTGAEDLSQMELLASSLDDFELVPGVTDAESYGRYMIQKSGKYDFDESLDCYYNYEAFGEFLMAHEVGQFTKHGYLKCEEGSTFLDFFTQDSPVQSQSQGQDQHHSQGQGFQSMQMGGM